MKIILTGIFLIFSTLCFSQTDSVEVKVKVFDDCKRTKVIAGAIVTLNDATVVTDTNGYCVLKAKTGYAYLQVKSIGYYTSYNILSLKRHGIKTIVVPLKVLCQ